MPENVNFSMKSFMKYKNYTDDCGSRHYGPNSYELTCNCAVYYSVTEGLWMMEEQDKPSITITDFSIILIFEI